MPIQLPEKPVRPDLDPSDPEYTARLLDYQQELSAYQVAVQIAVQEMSEQTTTSSNLERARHEAMMAIIRNLT